jgi:CheY-like chemotaxis protein
MQSASASVPDSLSVLVVDDDRDFLELFVRQLAALGHQATTVDSGMAALETLRARPFDVVVCDLVMPGLDGHDVLAQMPENPDRPAFILVSADPGRDDIIEAFRSGAADVLVKPVSRTTLSRALRRVRPDGPGAPRSIGGAASFGAATPPGAVAATSGASPTPGVPGQATETPTAPDSADAHAGDPADRLALLDAVRRGVGVPPPPPRSIRLLDEMAQTDSIDPDRLEALVAADAGLSSTLVRLANSPQYRGSTPLTSTHQAVVRLGARRALASAVTAAHRATYAFQDPVLGDHVTAVWLNHFVTATLAELLAQHVSVPHPTTVQCNTLFMLVGEVVALRAAASLWPSRFERGRPTPDLAPAVEHVVPTIGAKVLRTWEMPAIAIVYAQHMETPTLNDVDPGLRDGLVAARLSRGTVSGRMFDPVIATPPTLGAAERSLALRVGRPALEDLARRAMRHARSVLDSA